MPGAIPIWSTMKQHSVISLGVPPLYPKHTSWVLGVSRGACHKLKLAQVEVEKAWALAQHMNKYQISIRHEKLSKSTVPAL